MPKYIFTIGSGGDFTNANTSEGKNLFVESLSARSLPALRQERKTIIGREGFLLVGEALRDETTRTAHVFMRNHTVNTPNLVFYWLQNNDSVIFSDDPTHYYKYSITDEFAPDVIINGDAYEFDIVFHLQPYAYRTAETTYNIQSSAASSGTSVVGAGNYRSLPLIRVGRTSASGGAGWIQWGSGSTNRIDFSDLCYPLFIDSALRDCYYEDSANGNPNPIITMSDFPTVGASGGARIITFGGNVNNLRIYCRDRDR